MKQQKNLQEAIEYLKGIFNKNPKNQKLLTLSEDEFMGELHMWIGMNLRNDWGLWYDDTEISRNFKDLGILHGDDRSGIILTTLYRELKNQPWGLLEQIEKYFDYWEEVSPELYEKMVKSVKNK